MQYSLNLKIKSGTQPSLGIKHCKDVPHPIRPLDILEHCIFRKPRACVAAHEVDTFAQGYGIGGVRS